MPIEKALLEAADWITAQLQNRANGLQSELAEVQAQLDRINAELKMSTLASQRRASFRVMDGVDYLCPQCWIQRSIKATLRPIPDDIMRCNTCAADFEC